MLKVKVYLGNTLIEEMKVERQQVLVEAFDSYTYKYEYKPLWDSVRFPNMTTARESKGEVEHVYADGSLYLLRQVINDVLVDYLR